MSVTYQLRDVIYVTVRLPFLQESRAWPNFVGYNQQNYVLFNQRLWDGESTRRKVSPITRHSRCFAQWTTFRTTHSRNISRRGMECWTVTISRTCTANYLRPCQRRIVFIYCKRPKMTCRSEKIFWVTSRCKPKQRRHVHKRILRTTLCEVHLTGNPRWRKHPAFLIFLMRWPTRNSRTSSLTSSTRFATPTRV